MNDMDYSVLMSVYDKVLPDELILSIDSMMNQTIKPEQFIIVKDGILNEKLDAVINEYLCHNPKIFTIIELKQNHGLAYALNVGIEASRNELIARMDSDDYSLPERCEHQVRAFRNDPDLVLLGTQMQYFDGSPENISARFIPKPTNMEAIKCAIRRVSPFVHPSVMYKKSAVLSCGGYDSQLRRRQDHDLFSKMISQGYKVKNLDEVLFLFRANDEFLIRNKNKESCRARMQVQKRIYERGECSFLDYLYVVIMMQVSIFMPKSIYEKVYLLLKSYKSKV